MMSVSPSVARLLLGLPDPHPPMRFQVQPGACLDFVLFMPSDPLAADGPVLSAVMPCLNEERTLAVCIQKAQDCFRRLGLKGEVVIADNGSTDASVEIATRLGARVVHQPVKGYGAALQKGIESARGDIIIMGDSDDSYDWSNLGPFVAKIREGFDLVMGNRFLGGIEPGAMPLLHRYLGNPVLSKISRLVYGAPVGDFHCGMRAFSRQALDRMHLRTTGMEFATEMVAHAAMQGLRIAEVPIKLYRDGRDRPPHLRSFRDGWRHLRFIFTYAPDYLYMFPAFLMLLPGLMLMALLFAGPATIAGQYVGIHFLALGSLLTLAGFNIFSFGVMAKLFLKRRLPNLKSDLADFASERFSLEGGLTVALLLLLVGGTTDLLLLKRWLATGQADMTDTVHAGFVATTLVVLGLNMFFTTFIINMINLDHPRSASTKIPE